MCFSEAVFGLRDVEVLALPVRPRVLRDLEDGCSVRLAWEKVWMVPGGDRSVLRRRFCELVYIVRC